MAIDRDKIARSALKFIQKGQYARAIDEYHKVLEIDPRDIRVRLKLIDLYGRVGKKRLAVEVCLEVAETYADQGFYLKAIAVYKQALRNDPGSADLWRNMAEMYAKQGLVGDALGAFKKAVDLLREEGHNSDAEALLGRMETLAPDNAAIKVHLAELLLEDGKFDEFEEILAKIVLQLRGEGRSRKLLKAVEGFYAKSNHHGAVRRRLAELYVDLGEEEKALQAILEGLAEDPADRDLRLLGLRTHLVLGNLEDARRMALGLYEEDPDDLFLLEQLASIAQARHDRGELVQAYRSMAKSYARKGLPEKEALYFRKVLEIEPENAEARLALGEVVIETPSSGDEWLGGEPSGSWEGAGVDPGAQELDEGLMEAELYLKYGIEEKAEVKLKELTELAPDNIAVRQKLRDLYQRRGARAEWVREQQLIADLFVRAKRESEALRAYQSVLEIDPGNVEAVKAIQYLKPDSVEPTHGSFEIQLEGNTLEFVQEGGEEQVVRAAPSEVDADALREGLAEADFYENQGMNDEAVGVLVGLLGTYPGSPHITGRLDRLGWKLPTEPAPSGDGFVDLQSEVLDEADVALGQGFEGFQDFEVSELDDIVSEFKSGIAERLDEGDFETHYNLGVAYREMGLFDDAVQEFKVSARSPEKACDSFTSLALVYRDQAKWGEARAAYRQALAVPALDEFVRASIFYELGDLAEAGGDWDEALQNFKKTFAVDPSLRDVAARIRKLETRAGG